MGRKKLTVIVMSLLIISISVCVTSVDRSQAQESPDVYIGVDISYGDVAEAKTLIDQVCSFTNLIVVGTSKITWYPDKVNETFQYAYDKGLSIISLPPALPDYSSFGVNKTEWYKYANETWGERLLGFYYLDEAAGRQLDGARYLINPLSTPESYVDAANMFIEAVSVHIDSPTRSDYHYKAFTSDYALYWFDYKAGYDTVFAELGWNYSRQLNIALCRGAAATQNKEWGAIITWTYNDPPYIESGEELYDDLVLAYENGAKYIVIFDGNEGWTHTILQQEHLDAMQQFWEYVQDNPREAVPFNERVAFVLPEGYGYGFRGPQDHIWGIWEADSLAHNLSIATSTLLSKYGKSLDIIYEDSPQPIDSYGYKQVFYWDTYSIPPPEISVLSPENKTYTENSVTLQFHVDLPVSWMGYSLDNQTQVTVTENTTLSDLSNGSHSITVFAENEYWDIVGVSETIHFTIADPPEPFPTTLALASAALSVAVIGVAVVVYFRRKR